MHVKVVGVQGSTARVQSRAARVQGTAAGVQLPVGQERAVPAPHPCSVYTGPPGGGDVNGASVCFFINTDKEGRGGEGPKGRLGVNLQFSDLPGSAWLLAAA